MNGCPPAESTASLENSNIREPSLESELRGDAAVTFCYRVGKKFLSLASLNKARPARNPSLPAEEKKKKCRFNDSVFFILDFCFLVIGYQTEKFLFSSFWKLSKKNPAR